jgi:hypothetical protein
LGSIAPAALWYEAKARLFRTNEIDVFFDRVSAQAGGLFAVRGELDVMSTPANRN